MNEILEAAEKLKARGDSAPRLAADPVNEPMIRHWAEALGDENPRYPEVAPPAMLQVWTMYGLRGERAPDDPLGVMMSVLDEAGYPSVVATNCEQTYHRGLRPGERVSVTSRLESVVGPKRTALGEGWFVTTHSTWHVGDEPVGEMRFRVLKYQPAPKPAGAPLRPPVSRDTAYFWEGAATGELRIQRCQACGLLRHPPGPMCPRCGATDLGYVVAVGRGEVFSYVVHHHPPMPGRTVPYVVALVELPEGVRFLAELVDVPPDAVTVGMPVRVGFQRIDDELTLPVWRPDREGAQGPAAGVAGSAAPDPSPGRGSLPELQVEATPTFIISTALATRDFQDVHHDRDAAVARGSKDIFLNILATTGLVQRYVTDWAGPDAVIRGVSLRLGVPCYAYDTLVFRGQVTETDGDAETVEVVGSNSLGDHVTATVRVAL